MLFSCEATPEEAAATVSSPITSLGYPAKIEQDILSPASLIYHKIAETQSEDRSLPRSSIISRIYYAGTTIYEQSHRYDHAITTPCIALGIAETTIMTDGHIAMARAAYHLGMA